MPLIATVDLRGSCPKKKDDKESPIISFAIKAGSRLPSNIPRYIAEQWLKSRHVARVDAELITEDGRVDGKYFDDAIDDFPTELGGQDATVTKDDKGNWVGL